MQYSILGGSDLKISKIGFGCMSLTGNTKDNHQIIDSALEKGINYFDTADIYDGAENENLIGSLLQSRRGQVVLATKVGNQPRPDGNGWDWNPSKEYIISSVEGSLRRLKTDYIDLYQLHGGTINDAADESIAAFEQLKTQGKIRYYGISSIRPDVIRVYAKRSAIISVMMQYSLLDRRPEEECLDLLDQQGISVVSRGSLAQGLLVDKAPKDYLGWSTTEVAKVVAALREVSDRSSSMAQTAIRFVLQRRPISSAVVGIRTLAQLEDIALAADLPPLTTEEMTLLTTVAASKFYKEHR